MSTLNLQFDRVVMPHSFAMARFVSCCNGICLSSDQAVYFWNPSIKSFGNLNWSSLIRGCQAQGLTKLFSPLEIFHIQLVLGMIVSLMSTSSSGLCIETGEIWFLWLSCII